MTEVSIRTGYGPRMRVPFETEGESLTKQAHRDECDVNGIMKRFERTGMIEHTARHAGAYGDFTMAQDYHACVNQVLLADEMFMSLPAKVRARFDHDPGAFLTFVDDPANVDEMRELGLLPPERPQKAAQGASEGATEPGRQTAAGLAAAHAATAVGGPGEQLDLEDATRSK